MTQEELAAVEKLKNALLDIFISEVKAATSWGDVLSLNYTFGQSGYTGIFTGLDKHYDSHWELLETIELVWDGSIKTDVNLGHDETTDS